MRLRPKTGRAKSGRKREKPAETVNHQRFPQRLAPDLGVFLLWQVASTAPGRLATVRRDAAHGENPYAFLPDWAGFVRPDISGLSLLAGDCLRAPSQRPFLKETCYPVLSHAVWCRRRSDPQRPWPLALRQAPPQEPLWQRNVALET
jgi:hypothetical protein